MVSCHTMDGLLLTKIAIQFVQHWISPYWKPVAAVAAPVIIYCIYQIHFHPLSRFPGPPTSRFCNFRALYYGLKGDLHLDVLRCHQKYGSVIRYTPSTVIWNNVAGMRDIYGVRKNVRKTRNYRFLDQGIPNILSASDKIIHAGRRRMLNACFTDTAIKSFQPRLLRHVRKFCNSLYPAEVQENTASQPSWGPVLDMSEWCAYLSFDLMTEFVFGRQSNLLGKSKSQAMLPVVEKSLDWVAVLYYLPLPCPELLTSFLFKIVNRRHGIFTRYIKSNLDKRHGLSDEDLSGDVFSHLVSSQDKESGEKLDIGEIQSECQLLSVAGFDTVSSALCATVFYLSHYPHAYSLLAAEIRATFQSYADIRPGKRLQECKYLNACIDESLRISPPICALVPREVEQGGETIDGDFIPEGYCVGTSIYAIQRSPEYFPQPHVYLPERWLTANESHTKAAFAPFSMGPRACIASSMAIIELQTTIAAFIWTFDFKLAGGPDGMVGRGSSQSRLGRTDPSEFQLYDRMTTRVRGPKIQLRPSDNARNDRSGC